MRDWLDRSLGSLSLASKLGLLIGIGLLTSAAVAILSIVGSHQVNAAYEVAVDLGRADAQLYHLDNRNHDLKANAYRAVIEADKSQVKADTVEDIASVNEVMAELRALDVERLRDELDDLAPQIEVNNAFVRGFVDDAGRDPTAAARRIQEIEDSNHALDDALDGLREEVDGALAGARAAAEAASSTWLRVTVVVLVLGGTAAVTLGAAIASHITQRLGATKDALDRLAARDVTATAPVVGSDEIAHMATATNEALRGTREMLEALSSGARRLLDSSTALAGASHDIAAGTTRAAQDVGQVATSSASLSSNVQTVAGATVEMNASISEIARSTAEAAQVTVAASDSAATAAEIVNRLGEASTQIGAVVQVITAIAEQTNLLALNATIEAARAGETGAGFAVVAGQVKELSQSTARATGDITRQVEAIQQDSTAAVAAITEITATIDQIRDGQQSIASATEEQTAATDEMSRNLHEVADESAVIARGVTAVSAALDQARARANQADAEASQLTDMAEQLRAHTATFGDEPHGGLRPA